MRASLDTVAPFPVERFRSHAEFETWLAASEARRSVRWLHEQSLASAEPAVVVQGTCGLCLVPTEFTAPTRGGEPAPTGFVPNWREGLHCGCEHRLINRQRAALHALAAERLLRPWTRILLMGEVAALRPFLAAVCDHVTGWPGPLETALGGAAARRDGYHLILSLEQMTARLARPEVFRALREMLAPGGTLALTAPFDIAAPGAERAGDGPIGWDALAAMTAGGFFDASVGVYWSEEFGYLGPFNTIVTGARL